MIRKAVYLGTFDPVHQAHVAVIGEAARIFDEVVVLLSDGNPEKDKAVRVFTVDERIGFLRSALGGLPNVTVASSASAPAQFAKSIGASWLVRGIRDAQDAPSELGFSDAMLALEPSVRVVWIRSYSTLSSTDLKRRARAGESLADLCSEEVARALEARLGSQGVP